TIVLTRAICVTTDPALRRILRRSLCAAGSSVEFLNEPKELLARDAPQPDLILIDGPNRHREAVETVLERLHSRGIVLGDDVDHKDALRLLRRERCNHLIGRQNAVDEDELVVTTVKILSGDIFGMEKYLTWGVAVLERQVTGYENKRLAIADVAEYAREVGC